MIPLSDRWRKKETEFGANFDVWVKKKMADRNVIILCIFFGEYKIGVKNSKIGVQ